MFADFLKRLIQPAPAPLDLVDSRLAMAALLVRVGHSDGVLDAAEKTQILTVLKTRYDLDQTGAEALYAQGEILEGEAPDTVRFTRAIKEAVAYEHRLGVIEALWSVVLADGVRDAEEDALLRLVASLLGVNDRDSAIARQKVAKSA